MLSTIIKFIVDISYHISWQEYHIISTISKIFRDGSTVSDTYWVDIVFSFSWQTEN